MHEPSVWALRDGIHIENVGKGRRRRCAPLDRMLVVVEEREASDGLVRDISNVLTSMCARLKGRCSQRAVHSADQAG
jgi:predicted site-specific integrase-resolvase